MHQKALLGSLFLFNKYFRLSMLTIGLLSDTLGKERN